MKNFDQQLRTEATNDVAFSQARHERLMANLQTDLPATDLDAALRLRSGPSALAISVASTLAIAIVATLVWTAREPEVPSSEMAHGLSTPVMMAHASLARAQDPFFEIDLESTLPLEDEARGLIEFMRAQMETTRGLAVQPAKQAS